MPTISGRPLEPPDKMVEFSGRPTRIYPAVEPHRHEEPSTRHRLTASAKCFVFYLCMSDPDVR